MSDVVRSGGRRRVANDGATATVPATARGRRTRDRLLGAARGVLEDRGYFGSSVAEITQRAGVALGALYRYFPSKEAMFQVVLRSLIHDMRTAASSAWGADYDPLSSLRAATRLYIEQYHRNGRLIAALVEMAAARPECAQLWWELRADIYRSMERYLRDAPALGDLDPKVTAITLGGMVEQLAYHSFVEAERYGRPTLAAEEAAETAAQIWYRTAYAGG